MFYIIPPVDEYKVNDQHGLKEYGYRWRVTEDGCKQIVNSGDCIIHGNARVLVPINHSLCHVIRPNMERRWHKAREIERTCDPINYSQTFTLN